MKKVFLLLSIILVICSCGRTDVEIKHSYQIENKTDGEIEVVFLTKENAELSDYKDGTGKKFTIEQFGMIEVFYLTEREGYTPNFFSTGFIIADGKEYKHTDKVGNKSILSVDAYSRMSETSTTTVKITGKKEVLVTTNILTIDNQFLEQ